ncbi:Alpha-soluble NSF attachment protein [Labeo rohita]|uniref:Alpha-soluble NSF attachment protein n=1 Tax=Labeo rohita TaxID=84645 RepID=A0ABQ8LTC5_LABRO|nr:Alpha-soluble NSF attachment protein [Labeo rohita]
MDNSGKEKEAMALMAEAEKKVKSSQSFFGSLFGGSSKMEDACDLYGRAANMFKMAKNWSAAGNAFSQAALLHLQMQSKHDAATNFIDAGNAFKKSDPQEAINCLNRAIEIYTDMGRFTIAAKHHVSIAEIYETELVDIDKAIAHYEQAADYYKGEESTSSANKCLLKVATYAAQLEQYPKAIEIYEQVATHAMDSALLKYSAKDYFFKAALCHFCVDMLNAKLAIQKYEEMFPAFSDSRECKLVKKLLDAFEEQNVDAYTDAVKEYDTISRLDQWLTTMLLRIKKSIQEDENYLHPALFHHQLNSQCLNVLALPLSVSMTRPYRQTSENTKERKGCLFKWDLWECCMRAETSYSNVMGCCAHLPCALADTEHLYY